jgi:hypothetical protein
MKSRKISSPEFQYLPHDKYFALNDRDDFLTPIYISLPDPPPLETIAGYGLPPEEQMFKRMEVPRKLISLENQVVNDLQKLSDASTSYNVTGYKIIKEFWDRLNSNASDYKEETKFIGTIWWHRIHGYWFFNNGKPTYITGKQFMYLNTWYVPDMKNKCFDYRDRDRRWYLAERYFRETDETFVDLDENHKAIKGPDGKYKMKSTGMKMFLGFSNTKGRRAGDTNKALLSAKEEVELGYGRYSSISSYTMDHAEGSFLKMLVPAWQHSPLWLKPIFSNSNDPSALEYNSPGNVYNEKALGGLFDYARTAKGSFYDGKKINGSIVLDEGAKHEDVDISQKWGQISLCLLQGSNRVGFAYLPSTVEGYDKGGGANFEKLMNLANFYVRNDNGYTQNKLARLFFRASDGNEGDIDKYGMSVEFEPTESQKKEGFVKGAYTKRMSDRMLLEEQNTPESLEELRSLKRRFPLEYLDSFIGESGALGWDIKKIDNAIKRIKMSHKPMRYTLYRDLRTGRVTSKEDQENGRFVLDLLPQKGMEGLKEMEQIFDEIRNEWKEVYVPSFGGTFLLSIDPTDFTRSTQKKIDQSESKWSKGAAALFWLNDNRMEAEDNPLDGITCVGHYLQRLASIDDFVNDMILFAEYYGALMCPESNKATFIKEVINKGYEGYFYYELDPTTKKRKAMPGVYTGTNKGDMFTYMTSYIKYRSKYDCNLEWWLQAKRIKSIEEMGSNDMIAAYGVGLIGLLGIRSGYVDVISNKGVNDFDAGSFMESVFN